ncbi:histidine phosphatase family protein [Cellulomonas sp. PhB150]|uniref:SixA phosphatase family protein n=1 Tax=Cellulomonas sp. PhB150 TaxID=2485188 RepID=UPI000F495F6F|nr:histidine phosphatase family protein [Cellulomonas sp. PhB150]ROS30404.1 phosphohistidine phosphatase [Cellulomonas sp. PhB150]
MTAPLDRRLVLLRHAKAEHPEKVDDHERALALPGRRQAGRVGSAMTEAGVAPDLVLCSTSLRTRQTWDLVRAGLAVEPPVEFREEVYLAGASALLALVQAVPDEVRTLLVVGHEPTMSHAAELLAGPGSEEAAYRRVQVGVPTASWSVLESPASWADWAPAESVLVGLHTPG